MERAQLSKHKQPGDGAILIEPEAGGEARGVHHVVEGDVFQECRVNGEIRRLEALLRCAKR